MCARGKGHENCDSCAFSGNCALLQNRERIPQERRRKAESNQAQLAGITVRAQTLGKWLWILFWLIIPSTVSSIMTLEEMQTAVPAVYMAGLLLSVACSVAHSLILLKIALEEDGYRTAGICNLFTAGVQLLMIFFAETGWVNILSVPAIIVGLVARYQEYKAHSAVLRDVDDALSAKWLKLWKWTIGLYAGILGSVLVTLLVPVLGAVLLLGILIGIIVVSILYLVYLYRTAEKFREYM